MLGISTTAVLCAFAKTELAGRLGSGRMTGFTRMSDAQAGLLVATPIIIVFAIALYRMGVLQRYSAVSAVVFSVAIAAVLFVQQ